MAYHATLYEPEKSHRDFDISFHNDQHVFRGKIAIEASLTDSTQNDTVVYSDRFEPLERMHAVRPGGDKDKLSDDIWVVDTVIRAIYG
jgi:hypothetical protein